MWDHLAFARSLEHSVWYVISSVVGTQKDETYFGGSRVVSPLAQPTAGPIMGEEALVTADIDHTLTRTVRQSTRLLETRRADLYHLD